MAQALLRHLEDSTTCGPDHKPHLPAGHSLGGFLGTKTEHLPFFPGSHLLLKAQPFPPRTFPTHPHPLQGHRPGCCGSWEDAGSSERGGTGPAGPAQCPAVPDAGRHGMGGGGAAPAAGSMNPATSGFSDRPRGHCSSRLAEPAPARLRGFLSI